MTIPSTGPTRRLAPPPPPFPWERVLSGVMAAGVLGVGAFIFWLAAGTDLAGLVMVGDLLLLSIAVCAWLLLLRSLGPLDPIEAQDGEAAELRTGRGSWPWA